MQIDQDQVLPVGRKPRSAPFSHITSPSVLFKPPMRQAGVLPIPSECDTDSSQLSFTLLSCFTPHYTPADTAGNLGKRRFLESFLPASAGGGCSFCCGFQGAEAESWVVLLNLNSWPLSGVTFKCFSLNETLAVPSWCFIKSQAGTGKDALEWNQGKRGPSWAPLDLLGPPCLLQLELSPSSQKNKETIFCFEGFCCCCHLFPVPCPTFQREKRIFDCSN